MNRLFFQVFTAFCACIFSYRERAGRIRLATTPNADEKSVEQFLEQNVEKGSTIRTDG
ncbi:MAG: transposase [Planctomycetes bacterium]|nr:transposase [Planctomycetota bacterium]